MFVASVIAATSTRRRRPPPPAPRAAAARRRGGHGQRRAPAAGAPAWLAAAGAGPRGGGRPSSRRRMRLTIAAAIPKGDRLEWMVQKLTEIGVDADRLPALRAQRGALGRRPRRPRSWHGCGASPARRRCRAAGCGFPVLAVRCRSPMLAATGRRACSPSPTARRSPPDVAPTRAHRPGGRVQPRRELGASPAACRCRRHVLRVETAALAAAILARLVQVRRCVGFPTRVDSRTLATVCRPATLA